MLQNPTLCAGIFIVMVFGLLAMAALYGSRGSQICKICKRKHKKPGELWKCVECGARFCNPELSSEEPPQATANANPGESTTPKACGGQKLRESAMEPVKCRLCARCIKRDPSKISGYATYTDLYYDLVDQLCREQAWRVVSVGVIGFVIVSILLFAALTWLLTGESNWVMSDPAGSAINMLLLAVWLLVILFVPHSIWINRQEPRTLAVKLTARLLTFSERPRTLGKGRFGLRLVDLEQLQSVAQIEQGSAGWRGRYVASLLIVIGVAIFFSDTGLEVMSQVSSGLVDEYIFLRDQDTLVTSMYWMMLFGTLVAFFLLIFAAFNYFRRFMVSELGNRTILLACEEGKRLLAEYGAADESPLTPVQKQALARQLGYIIDDAPPLWRIVDVPGFDDEAVHDVGGSRWFLIPLRPSRLQSLFAKFWFKESMDVQDKEQMRDAYRALESWVAVQVKTVATKAQSLFKRQLFSTQTLEHYKTATRKTPNGASGAQPEKDEEGHAEEKGTQLAHEE